MRCYRCVSEEWCGEKICVSNGKNCIYTVSQLVLGLKTVYRYYGITKNKFMKRRENF